MHDEGGWRRCTKCGLATNLTILLGSDSFGFGSYVAYEEKLDCPCCGEEMKPAPGRRREPGDVFCRNCNAFFGPVAGELCPRCGHPATHPGR